MKARLLVLASIASVACAPAPRPAPQAPTADGRAEQASTHAVDPGPVGRPSVRLEKIDEPSDVRPVFDDDSYAFVYRDFGFPGRETTPGFFVQAKSSGAWAKITEVSTEHAALGRSTTLEENLAMGSAGTQVGWDFAAQYGHLAYAPMPLKTGGSIAFPNAVRFEPRRMAYELWFLGSSAPQPTDTKLEIRKADIDQAFAR